MKKALFSGVLLACSALLPAQVDEWRQIDDIPGRGRNHAVMFSIDGQGYVLTGSYQRDFYRLDGQTEKWVKLNDFPGGGRHFSVGFDIDGKGYITMGLSQGSRLMNDLWEYNPQTDSWSQKASCPCQPRYHPAVGVVNGKAYVAMGQNYGGDLGDMWEYNPQTDMWTQKADFPKEKRHHPMGTAIGEKFYLGFGHTQTGDVNQVYNDWWSYNPVSNQWVEKAPYPGPERVAGVAVNVNGKAYVGLGEDEVTYDRYDDWYVYSAAEETWTQLDDYPGGPNWAPEGFVVGNTIYIGTGQNDYGQDTKSFYAFEVAAEATSDEQLTSKDNWQFVAGSNNHWTIRNEFAAATTGLMLKVHNLSGQLLVSKEVENGQCELDLSALAAGTYLTSIYSNEERIIGEKLKVQ